MFYLKRNLSIWQSILRVCISVCLITIAYSALNSFFWQLSIIMIAIFFGTTAIMRYCPLMTKIKTRCKR